MRQWFQDSQLLRRGQSLCPLPVGDQLKLDWLHWLLSNFLFESVQFQSLLFIFQVQFLSGLYGHFQPLLHLLPFANQLLCSASFPYPSLFVASLLPIFQTPADLLKSNFHYPFYHLHRLLFTSFQSY